MILLVDTNVFLDFFLKREPFFQSAKQLFLECRRLHNSIYVTSMSLRDIEYIAHRFMHDKNKSKEILLGAYQMCQRVINVSADDAIEAMYSESEDFEDALIVEAAKSNLVDAIVTNNTNDYKKCSVPIFTTDKICELFSKM